MVLQPVIQRRDRQFHWLHGPASYKDGWLTLNASEAEEYIPELVPTQMVFDFTAVKEPGDAVAFIGRYGLLRHGRLPLSPKP